MVSGPVGENTRVYIAAANTAGISGGKDIPAVCTNWGIYQYVDFLFDSINSNFVASKVSRHSEALNMTLQTLTPGAGGDKSSDPWDRLNKAKRDWLLEAAANEVQMKTNAIGGAGSALLAEAMKSAANRSNTLTELKGYNMKASIQSVTYDAAGKPILPDPLETQYVPQYSISGYAAMLDGWVGFSKKKPDEFGISLSTGQQSSFKDIGFTEAQGSASFSGVPVFDFYASGGGRVEHSNFHMSSDATDVKSLMAKLGAKPPAMFQKVRPTQMLIAQGVSMEISFGGDAKTAFDQDYKKTVQAGGGISVFGFRIGSSGSSSEENESHGNTWDSSSGVLTINAENSRGSANVLAVMGEIVSA
ncbi:hypothetical protein FocTR4_00003491 [Fusarium oxysporum f. sp. cubense]|uniref:Uncharacterized protein n=1 Tax=Fusarium oxysporum f. sp. cubense TaxID=61366 RepID=A0A5C6TEA0_FUSOC|nr:hypothetical protein FocTR4_00003491 [Fusarium oxysporum f. sp. cubense]